METTTFNIIDLDKAGLIMLAKEMEISFGDYARKTKKVIFDGIVMARTESEIQACLDTMVERGDFEVAEEEISDDMKNAMALIDLLKSSKGVDEATVTNIVRKELGKVAPREIIITRPDLSHCKIEGYVRPEFESLLLKASLGLNIMIVGPAGSGKTHLAHQVSEALGRKFASLSCTAGMSESALQGWLLPSDNGKFEYQQSDFVDMYENGGVFLFDEIDAADSNTLLFVNQALANGGFNIPQRKGNSYVKRHPDFVCIACANTFGTGGNMQYAGRERLDESTLDRFRAGMMMLEYDTVFEKQVIHPAVFDMCSSVRSKIKESKLNRVMSTRFMLDATKLVNAGVKVSDVMDTYFIGWKAEEKSKVF